MSAGPSAQSVSGERDSHSLRRKGAGCARHRSRGGPLPAQQLRRPLTRIQPSCRLRNAARDSAVGVGARAVASPRPAGMSRSRNTAQSAPHFVPSVNRGADILSEYRQAIDEHIREGKMPTPTGVFRCPNPNSYSYSPNLQLAPLWCSRH